jgi:predicted MFS family arabinose efflux permease
VLSAGAGICAYTYTADILGHAVGAAGWVFVVLPVVYGVGAFAGSLGFGVITD